MYIRRIALVLAVAAVATVLGGTSALAQQQPQVGFTCGRVTAFTAPTGTSDGSIAIGTMTFVARAGSLPNPPPPIAVGTTLCLTGQMDASGAFTSLTASTFGDTVCGTVVAFSAPSATAAGTLTIRTNAEWTLPVRAGTTLNAAQTTGSQCFTFALNAQGNAEIIASAGAPKSGTTAGQTGAPSQLPSTSVTASEPASQPVFGLALVLVAAAIAGAVIGGLAIRRGVAH